MSGTSQLFSPFRMRGLTLANRIVVPPMCQYSADYGSANDWHMMHIGSLANSGAGLFIVEATEVEPEGRITHGCVGLWSDENEHALKRVIDGVRRFGTAKLGIQLAHAGRKASCKRPWEGKTMSDPLAADPWQTRSASATAGSRVSDRMAKSNRAPCPVACNDASIAAMRAKVMVGSSL